MSCPDPVHDAHHCRHVWQVTYYGHRCILCGLLDPDVEWDEDGDEAEPDPA